MVGHTGVFDAAKEAVETVDKCVGRVVDKILEKIENPAVVAFSTYLWNCNFNKEVARRIKEKIYLNEHRNDYPITRKFWIPKFAC